MEDPKPTYAQEEMHTSERRLFDSARPELHALFEYWLSVKPEDGLPDRSRFDFTDLRPWLGNVSIAYFDPERADVFLELSGTNIVDLLGVEMTRHWMSEFLPDPNQLAAGIRPYIVAHETQRPTYGVLRVRRVTPIARLILPILNAAHDRREYIAAMYLIDPSAHVGRYSPKVIDSVYLGDVLESL